MAALVATVAFLLSSNLAFGQHGHLQNIHQTTFSAGTHMALAVQPPAGASIYLFAVGATGYGSAPASLLHGTGVAYDAAGNGYVTTDNSGNFSISNLYVNYCPSPNASIYLLARGGNYGGGSNPASVLISAMPATCSQLPNAPSVYISEATTIAASYALAPYANVQNEYFGTTPTDLQGIANAFAYSNELVSGYNGQIFTTTPSGNGTIPVSTLNTLADMLTPCVDSNGGSPCTTLFTDATPNGGTAPVDTLQAALDIALNPSNNVYPLYHAVDPGHPYSPYLTSTPPDWSLNLQFANPVSTQTAVVVTPTQSIFGYSVVATVSVVNNEKVVPPGSASCFYGWQMVGAATPLDDRGNANIVVGGLPVGSDSVTCNFQPSANAYTSSSGTTTATVAASTPPTDSAANPVTARAQHTANLLSDGTVLIAGGTGMTGNFQSTLQSAELYNPATGSYTSEIMSSSRTSHQAVTLENGNVLVMGGFSDTAGIQNTTEIYTHTVGGGGDVFNPGPPMKTPRVSFTATELKDGTVLIAGGLTTGNAVTNSLEIYDPKSNDFKLLGTTLLTARYAHTATLLQDGTVLFAGGADSGSNAVASAEVYNPSNQVITAVSSPMNASRVTHTATLLPDGEVLIAGGACNPFNDCALGSAELYNPGTQAFTLTNAMILARFKHTATLLEDGTVLIAGGEVNGNANTTASTEIYNPVSNSWSSSTPLAGGRYNHAAITLGDGTIYFSGGWSGDVNGALPQSTTEQFSFPYVSGNIHPKYMVLSIFYAPPGAKSSAEYGSTIAVGNSSSVKNSFTSAETVSFGIGKKLSIFGTGVTDKQTLTYSSNFSQEDDTSTSKSVMATDSYSYVVQGPGDSSLGVSHDEDTIAIWLNPVLTFTLSSNSKIVWNGYRYDSNDTNVPNMDVVYLTVAQLKNPALITDQKTQGYLARSWDTSGVGGLIPADYEAILRLDPYAYNSPNIDATRFIPNPGTPSVPYGPTGPCPAQPGEAKFTGVYSQSTTNGTGYQNQYGVGYSIESKFSAMKGLMSLDLKDSTTFNWTTEASTSATTAMSNSSTGIIVGPLCSDNYNGPTTFNIYRDLVYGTFLFVGAP